MVSVSCPVLSSVHALSYLSFTTFDFSVSLPVLSLFLAAISVEEPPDLEDWGKLSLAQYGRGLTGQAKVAQGQGDKARHLQG